MTLVIYLYSLTRGLLMDQLLILQSQQEPNSPEIVKLEELRKDHAKGAPCEKNAACP